MHHTARVDSCQPVPSRLDSRRRLKCVQAAAILLRTCGVDVSVRNVCNAIRAVKGKSFRSDDVRRILGENGYFHETGHARDTKRTRSDEERDTPRSPSCARTLQETETENVVADATVHIDEEHIVGKIVSPVKRESASAQAKETADAPQKPIPQKSPRESKIDELVKWYGSQTWGQQDRSAFARRKWSALLDMHDDVEKIKQLAIEARQNKHLVLNSEFPSFTVHSIWFYARFKCRDDLTYEKIDAPMSPKAKQKIKEYIDLGTPGKASAVISMFAVRREQVRGAFSESDARLLFETISDGAWGKDRGNTA